VGPVGNISQPRVGLLQGQLLQCLFHGNNGCGVMHVILLVGVSNFQIKVLSVLIITVKSDLATIYFHLFLIFLFLCY
jgi:hypothetical protein